MSKRMAQAILAIQLYLSVGWVLPLIPMRLEAMPYWHAVVAFHVGIAIPVWLITLPWLLNKAFEE